IIGPKFTVYSANHNFRDNIQAIPYDSVVHFKKVKIGENVWIGGNVILVPGVEIGEGAVIAAGAVVTKNIAACDIVGGNPAKKIGMRNVNTYFKLKQEGKIYMAIKNGKAI